ncbi:MAG: nucleotidyltransferase family protein, partial [Anaerolineae bacterium]|nr:nucleotidyltransferase family protein [Gemmatimonadaceae bacterium]
RHAPSELAERWRVLFRDVSVRGHAQLAEAAISSARLSSRGLTPIVLKGAPLSHRLYGDPTVRACTDIDLFIPAEDRLAARSVLIESGWCHYDGDLPWDESLERETWHGNFHLEIHSSLIHGRFSYLRLPHPESELIVLDGERHLRHAGDGLPAYLAMHLATHAFPPLLWLVDFSTLWDSLSEPERGAARRAADKAGLGRYLAWACRTAVAARLASEGRLRSQRRIGVNGDNRTNSHPVWRHVWLAPSPRAALSALRSWIAPPWVKGTPIQIAARVTTRILRHWRATLPRSRSPLVTTSTDDEFVSGWSDARVTHVAGRTMLEVVGEVVKEGGEMWIVTTGSSMQPTLAPGDRVLLSAAKGIRKNHIVLAAVNGQPILHRVVSAYGGTVTTRGDACETADTSILLTCVVARAVAMRNDRGVSSLDAGLRFGARALVGYARSRARLVIARLVIARRAEAKGIRAGNEGQCT